MSEAIENALKNRYDFSIFFDVENGNPNGDPDAGNMPRVDDYTGKGLVTDVCLKRKIRNYVQLVKNDTAPWRIYIQERKPLNSLDEEAFTANDIDPKKLGQAIKDKDIKDIDWKLRQFMCEQFFDIRTFGAVMTTFNKGDIKLASGQVRGPVQLGFAQSIDPVDYKEVTITRIAITTAKDAEHKRTEMGNKYIIPYALYRVDGFISAKLAEKVTGFSEEDLEVLWKAILNMFEFDRSAARGKMAVRKLYTFKHSNDLRDAPSYKLFESISVKHSREDIEVVRQFSDYKISFDESVIPSGVEVTEKVENKVLKSAY